VGDRFDIKEPVLNQIHYQDVKNFKNSKFLRFGFKKQVAHRFSILIESFFNNDSSDTNRIAGYFGSSDFEVIILFYKINSCVKNILEIIHFFTFYTRSTKIPNLKLVFNQIYHMEDPYKKMKSKKYFF
jgi:hypothetical protein